MTSDYKVVLSPSCTDDIESIKSYIAIYKIDEHTRTVMILRMFHSTQNVEDKYLIEVN